LPPADSPVWKATCTGDYMVRAGPAVSHDDAELTDFLRPGDTVQAGQTISFQLKLKDNSAFPHCMITSSAYEVRPTGERHILTQRDRELDPTTKAFDKSWVFGKAGKYFIEFREASTKRVLATYEVTAAAK
jgi:hypothetical protein